MNFIFLNFSKLLHRRPNGCIHLDVKRNDLRDNLFGSDSLEEATSRSDDGRDRWAFLHHFDHVIGRFGQQAFGDKADHALVNGNVQRIGHIAEQDHAVVRDGVVGLFSLFADIGAIKGRNNGGEGFRSQMQLFVFADSRHSFLLNRHDGFGHASINFDVRVEDHVGAGRIFLDRGGKSSHVRTLHDKEHVVVARHAFGVVFGKGAASALDGLQVTTVVRLTVASGSVVIVALCGRVLLVFASVVVGVVGALLIIPASSVWIAVVGCRGETLEAKCMVSRKTFVGDDDRTNVPRGKRRS